MRESIEEAGPRDSGQCPICKSANHTVYLNGAGTSFDPQAFGSSRTEIAAGTILRCRECGFGYARHRPTDDQLGRLYREMDIAVYQAEAEGRRRTAERHLKIVSSYLSGGRLLDVGCASGAFLDRAESAGWDVVGVEPSPPLYEMARDLLAGRGEVLPVTLQEANLEPQKFDVITLWDVLEHVADPIAFLVQCRSLLNSGGFVFANVPDLDSVPARLLGRRWPLLLPEHLNYFNRPSLARCVQGAGLEVVRFGRRPTSFSLSYILYRVAQHDIPGVNTLGRISDATGLGRLILPVPIGETLVVCHY
ncbi:MAG: class I SAM-dependent methyltransferase [Acidobacteria bacterium]|nr:class I SAM-dependent methyltransferase [Acidobacteriota bacterium]